MNNNVVESIIASIIFAILSTGLGLLLQVLGLSAQASIIVALFTLLILMILFIAFKHFYPIYIKWLTRRLLENVLHVKDPNDPKMAFKKEIVERVLRDNPIGQLNQNSPIIVYPNQDACETSIREACQSAKKIKILTARGEGYFLGSKSLLYDSCLSKQETGFTILVLVLSPRSGHITEELAMKLGHDSAQRIRGKMQSVLGYLKFLASNNKNFKVKCYNEAPNFKILLFDNVMFVSAFTEPKNDRNAKMLRIMREGTPLFKGLEKHFDDLWERSVNPESTMDGRV